MLRSMMWVVLTEWLVAERETCDEREAVRRAEGSGGGRRAEGVVDDDAEDV